LIKRLFAVKKNITDPSAGFFKQASPLHRMIPSAKLAWLSFQWANKVSKVRRKSTGLKGEVYPRLREIVNGI
jgi:hypothetical protein